MSTRSKATIAALLVGLFAVGPALPDGVQNPSSSTGIGTVNGALKGNGSGVISQAACADLSNGTANCSAAVGQLPGSTTNDSASAGKVGEFISGTLASGSPTSLTTATAKTVTSVSLTAGDWDVWGSVYYAGGATTNVSFTQSSISTTNNTLDATNGSISNSFVNGVPFGSVSSITSNIGPIRISVSSTTTVYLIAAAAFTVSTATAYGIIQARRAR